MSTYTCAAEQGVDTFLQHWITPILKENDELKDENLKLKKELERLKSDANREIDECSICGKYACRECDIYVTLCSQGGEFYCNRCKSESKGLCKYCFEEDESSEDED